MSESFYLGKRRSETVSLLISSFFSPLREQKDDCRLMHTSDFFLSILIFRTYPGLMGVHLIRSMGAAQRRMQNVNQDGQRREGKKGKGRDEEVYPVCLFGTCKKHRVRFSKKAPQNTNIAVSPPLFAHAQIKLTTSLPCLISGLRLKNLGDVTARKWEQAESQTRREFALRPFKNLFPPKGARISSRLLLLVF